MDFNQYWATVLSAKFQGQLIKETPELLEQKNIALAAWYAALKVGTNQTFPELSGEVTLNITSVNWGGVWHAAPDLLLLSYTFEELNTLTQSFKLLSQQAAVYYAFESLGSFTFYKECSAGYYTHSGVQYKEADYPVEGWCTKLYRTGELQFVSYLKNDPGEVWANVGTLNEVLAKAVRPQGELLATGPQKFRTAG